MHKLQNGSQVTGRPVRKPRVGTRGYFSESNDQGAPSHPGQDWFNDCIDEFANALEQADIPYDPQRLDHLARAIAEAKANWGADIVPQAEAQAGTATTARKWTAQRVRQSVAAAAVMLSGNQTISGIKTFADKLITIGTVAIRASANDFALYINSNGLSTEGTQAIGTDQKNGTWRLGTPLPDSVAFGCNSNQRILFGVYDPVSGQFTNRAGVRQDGQFQTKVAGESSQVMDSFSCRAWVNFDGTAAPVIRGSANISSVVKTSSGSFALNLATPMPDEKYAVIYTTGIDDQATNAASVDNAGNLTPSSFKLFSRTVSAAETGRPNNFVAIYR
ncbi:hypothetical protein ACXHQT_02540 [Vibrio cincinnatiensis]